MPSIKIKVNSINGKTPSKTPTKTPSKNKNKNPSTPSFFQGTNVPISSESISPMSLNPSAPKSASSTPLIPMSISSHTNDNYKGENNDILHSKKQTPFKSRNSDYTPFNISTNDNELMLGAGVGIEGMVSTTPIPGVNNNFIMNNMHNNNNNDNYNNSNNKKNIDEVVSQEDIQKYQTVILQNQNKVFDFGPPSSTSLQIEGPEVPQLKAKTASKQLKLTIIKEGKDNGMDLDADVEENTYNVVTSDSVIIQRRRAKLLAAPPRPLKKSKDDKLPFNSTTTSTSTRSLLKLAWEKKKRRESKTEEVEECCTPESDPNLFMNQSCRSGWGQCGTFTQIVLNRSTGKYEVKIHKLSSVSGEPPLQRHKNNDGIHSILKEAPMLAILLDAQYNEKNHKNNLNSHNMELDTKNDSEQKNYQIESLPLPTGMRFATMIHKYAKLHEEAADMYQHNPEIYERQIRESSIWRLVSALWGSPSDSKGAPIGYFSSTLNLGGNCSKRTHLLRRRLAIIAWLRETISKSLKDKDASTSWEALTRLDVLGACKIALTQKNTRLASLLSQSTGRQLLRSSMADQMKVWSNLKNTSIDLQRAYLLLSGELDNKLLRVEGITWFQDFALRLCYNGGTNEDKCTTSDAVKLGLKSYERAFKKKPQPTAVTPFVSNIGKHLDLRYLLLKLECLSENETNVTAKDCLKTKGFTSNPMDHALVWHLYQSMKSIEMHKRDITRSQKAWLTIDEEHWLTSNYSAQLENVGLWHWSIYVANHLPDEERRGHRIRSILFRNCPSLESSSFEEIQTFNERKHFLVQNINIDPAYFYRARVQRARYDHVHSAPNKQEYADMADAKLLNPLHRDVFLHLLPQCMLEGKDDMLRMMLDMLSEASNNRDSEQVGDWQSSGDVVKLYLDVKNILYSENRDLGKLRYGIEKLTRSLGGSTIEAGNLKLPENAKSQHDTSGLVVRARRLLTICEQQMIGNISEWRSVMNEIEKKDPRDVVLTETGLHGEFGALTLGLEAGTLVTSLRRLLQKWLDAFASTG